MQNADRERGVTTPIPLWLSLNFGTQNIFLYFSTKDLFWYMQQRKNNKLLHKRQNHTKKIVNYSLPHQQVTIHYRTITRGIQNM